MNILILGGSKFVGKNFVYYMSLNSDYSLILANRGITKAADIIINRDNEKDCFNLKDKEYDIVVDFSCYNLNHFKNTYQYLKFNKYIFISTSAVEGIPFQNVSPDMYEMARYAHNKKECEDFIVNNIKSYSIIRPCYVVGEGDYTNRFYKKDNKYYWNNGLELTYYIEVDALSELIFNKINDTSNSIENPCKK
jgi:nucleoside-diphosphate-sugar epimerase